MRRVLIALLMALLIGVLYPVRGIDKAAVVNSRHDFRITSSATIRATAAVNAGEQLCVFCHTPHNSNPGTELWNQNMGSATFGTYTSSTLQSTVPARIRVRATRVQSLESGGYGGSRLH
jgi:hypothetical protein